MSAELFPAAGVMQRNAVITCDGRYRWWLSRRWGEGLSVAFVMLNPSTADADVDDPTIRRCIGFARSWNWNAIEVVNLFAWRATDPKALAGVDDPVGLHNAAYLRRVMSGSAFTVAAWGAHPAARPMADGIVALAAEVGATLRCLGTTKDGAPRHPLYVRGDQPLRFYPEPTP